MYVEFDTLPKRRHVKYNIKKDRCRRGDVMRAFSGGPKMATGVYIIKKNEPAASPPCPPYTLLMA